MRSKIVNVLLLIAIFCTYLVWDYNHHDLLARTVSKNMLWLGFLYPGGTIQYSWDLIILAPIFIGLILLSVGKGIRLKIIAAFGVLTVIIGIVL